MSNTTVLQKLVDSNHKLVSFETPTPERISDMFRYFNMETGCAVYDWNDVNGLHRLGFEHILIPRTKSSSEILSYILTARHFGIYVIANPKQFFAANNSSEIITEICMKADGVRRLIVFIGDGSDIPHNLKHLCVTIKHSREKKKKIKQSAPIKQQNADKKMAQSGLQRLFNRNQPAAAVG